MFSTLYKIPVVYTTDNIIQIIQARLFSKIFGGFEFFFFVNRSVEDLNFINIWKASVSNSKGYVSMSSPDLCLWITICNSGFGAISSKGDNMNNRIVIFSSKTPNLALVFHTERVKFYVAGAIRHNIQMNERWIMQPTAKCLVIFEGLMIIIIIKNNFSMELQSLIFVNCFVLEFTHCTYYNMEALHPRFHSRRVTVIALIIVVTLSTHTHTHKYTHTRARNIYILYIGTFVHGQAISTAHIMQQQYAVSVFGVYSARAPTGFSGRMHSQTHSGVTHYHYTQYIQIYIYIGRLGTLYMYSVYTMIPSIE